MSTHNRSFVATLRQKLFGFRPVRSPHAVGPVIFPGDINRFRETHFHEYTLVPQAIARALEGRETILITSLSPHDCTQRLYDASERHGALHYMDSVYGTVYLEGFALQSFRAAQVQGVFAPVAYGRYRPINTSKTEVIVRIAQPGQPLFAHVVFWILGFALWLWAISDLLGGRDRYLVAGLVAPALTGSLIWYAVRYTKGFWWLDAIEDLIVIDFLRQIFDSEPEQTASMGSATVNN